jgi:hypothetical protein
VGNINTVEPQILSEYSGYNEHGRATESVWIVGNINKEEPQNLSEYSG